MTHLSSYEQFIEEAKSRVEKADTSCFFVMYLDIAGFQLVNDFYGMEEGNRLLMALESHMEELPDVCLCRRVFSDHYLCLFAVEETDDLSVISRALLADLRNFRDVERCHHKSCNLHLIGGLCHVNGGASGVVNAIDNANIARKKFKDIMRTSLTWFDGDMQERIEYIKQLEVDIQDAFDNDGFTFHLQPKVSLMSGKIVGSEALARWVRPDGSEVSPGSFIPVMERNETIFALDYLMYDKVCCFLKSQIDRGENPLPVSVNMSRLHTQNPDTADRIHELVSRYGIPPYLLEFELTETAMMRDLSVAKAIMSKLREYGYKTSIDDYGSGYAGIMTFQELDFDVLKLDRTFLDEEDGKALRNDAIVRHIVMLAVDFQTTVLCEGIETADQCGRMTDLGCQVAQGYYFSRPLPAEEYLQFCADRKGYCMMPWTSGEPDALAPKEEQNTLAPEHMDIGQIPESQSRSITQSIFHTMPFSIAGFNDNRRLLFGTPEYYALIGYSGEELLSFGGEELDRLLDAKFLVPSDEERLKESLEKNRSIHLEYYVTRKDGERIYVSMYAGRASSPEWGPYILCAFFDETARKKDEVMMSRYRDQIQVERERADSRLRAAVEMIGVSISEFDFETGIIYTTPQGCELTEMMSGTREISIEDFIRAGMVRSDYVEAYLDLFTQMNTKDEVYLEYPYLLREGVYEWVALNAKVAVRENGKPVRGIAACRLIESREEEPVKGESVREEPIKRKEKYFPEWLGGIMKPGRIAGLLALIIVAVSAVVDIGFIRFRRGLEKEFTEFFSDGLMAKHVDVVMKNTVFISLVLIAFCLVAGLLSFYGYLSYKKKLVLENERYAMLSEFSDTVLFQYFYKSDMLVLTPNANERFLVNTLQKKHYLKEDISVLNLYSGDWLLVKDALEHPAGANATKTIRIRVKGKNGAFLWCSLQMRFLYDDEKVIAVVGKVTDISSQKAREEKLVQQAEMDGLTHVYNKLSAENKISEQIENGMAGTLFMMDMDNFKKINDVYGHTKGDEALIHLGSVLKEVFREDDIIGRIGGDEFVAYVLDISKDKPAEEYAKSIFDRMKVLAEQIGMEITISIGMASCPADGGCYQDIYRAADQAMYQAKRLGKNRYYQK